MIQKFNWKKGSSTIEAAYLVPFLVTIIVLLIYLSFFLYNRLFLTETAYVAVLRGSQMEHASASESYKEICDSSDELLRGHLLAVDCYERQVSAEGKQMHITLQITQIIPFSRLIKPLIGSDELVFRVEKSAKKQNPYQFIRESRRFAKE